MVPINNICVFGKEISTKQGKCNICRHSKSVFMECEQGIYLMYNYRMRTYRMLKKTFRLKGENYFERLTFLLYDF